MVLDQPLRDAGALEIEVVRPVGRLADQHDPTIGDLGEQFVVVVVAALDGTRRIAERGERTAACSAKAIGEHGHRSLRQCWTNQSAASSATCSSVPGSSNRWVAPGTTVSWFSHRSLPLGLLVQQEHRGVGTADDQQRGRMYVVEPIAGQVRDDHLG